MSFFVLFRFFFTAFEYQVYRDSRSEQCIEHWHYRYCAVVDESGKQEAEYSEEYSRTGECYKIIGIETVLKVEPEALHCVKNEQCQKRDYRNTARAYPGSHIHIVRLIYDDVDIMCIST